MDPYLTKPLKHFHHMNTKYNFVVISRQGFLQGQKWQDKIMSTVLNQQSQKPTILPPLTCRNLKIHMYW